MDLQPQLSGNLLTLRPTVAADYDALYAVARDPLIWEVHPQRDRWQEPVFRKFFDTGLASGGNLTVIDNASGAVIGASRYCFPDPARDQVEIGFTFLARAYWGGVYNRELKRLMLDHAHRFFASAVFVVGEHNIRSRRAMEKIGGMLEAGRTRRGDGSDLPDHVYYVIARG